jgi:cell division septal protein FtsQ
VRRTRPVRRASAGVTPVRAGALLVLVAGVAGLYGLASSDAFTVERTTVTGATWTDEAAILERLAIPPGSNLFLLRTGELERALTGIPAIRGATVTIVLPDEVRVVVDERSALVAWKVGERAFLVDGEGRLFAELATTAEARPPEAEALPLIVDARLASMAYEVGTVLDAVTLDAALRLASLTPADVGSGAGELVLRLDDDDGFSMRTRPASWVAVFGFYSRTLRTTGLIPGQVRLLRSLLAGREGGIARIVLADDTSGTYIPAATPEPTPSAKPDRTPRPSRTPRPGRATPSPAPSATSAPTATPRP